MPVGDYAIQRAMVVRVPLTIRGVKGGERPVVRFNGTEGRRHGDPCRRR